MKVQTGRIPAAVAVDGARARSIREEKRLTQLYVASVVGVTTDTISRWENNRYPTIKGENALKLAEALEVPLEEILRQEDMAVSEETVPAEQVPEMSLPSRRPYFLPVVAVVGLCLAIAVFLLWGKNDASAVRRLPHGTAPGMLIPVQIRVQAGNGGTGGVIVREKLPDGWILEGALPPTAGHGTTGEVRWLLPEGGGTTILSYTVKVPSGWPQGKSAGFSGSVTVDSNGLGRPMTTGGEKECLVSDRHWADVNGDGRIDDQEIMPAYYLTEEMKGMLQDWPLIERIWGSRGYEWDQQRKEYRVVE